MSEREPPFKGYKMKLKPIGNPDDPIWRGIERIRRIRIEAMRRCLETGERYRDPLEDR